MSEASDPFDGYEFDPRDADPVTPEQAGIKCSFCHEGFTVEELDDPNLTYIEVASWVTGPKLQSPVMREQTGRRAHKSCIDKALDGEAADQQPLPGFED